MNHSDDDAQKSASWPLADSEKNETLVVSFSDSNYSTLPQICQKNDDTLTLTEALEFSDWDTTAWVESQVMAGRMSPSWAREYHGYCPQWLTEYVIANFSMAGLHP